MKNIEYKYQNYNKQYLYAEAIISTYIDSMKAIKNKKYNDTDIQFCKSFEPVVLELFKTYQDKSGLWKYILFNEFPKRNKTYTKKEFELAEIGIPVSRPSYYREVVLFTNLIAESFGLGDEYVKGKSFIIVHSTPSKAEVKNYIIQRKAS